MSGRQKVAAVLAEFLGTYALASVMLAMLIRTNFEFFSGAAAAVVYGLMLLIFGNTSGSHLNPVVTLGLWVVRKVSTVNAIVYIIAQLVAGFVAWRLGQYFISQALSKTATGGFNTRVFLAEAIGTLIFTFAVAAAVSKQFDLVRRATVSALGLFAGILVASLISDGLLNPAVDIAVRSVSWAYILGPIVGALVGFILYEVLFSDVPMKFNLSRTLGKSYPTKTITKKTAKPKK